MKRLQITTALALGVLASSAYAGTMSDEEQYRDYKKYSCVSMCPFFSAWAMTRTCHGVSFNERGRSIAKDFSKTAEDRRWSREVVREGKQSLRLSPSGLRISYGCRSRRFSLWISEVEDGDAAARHAYTVRTMKPIITARRVAGAGYPGFCRHRAAERPRADP